MDYYNKEKTLTGWLCLSDIPTDMVERDRSGKKYVKVEISELLEVPQFGPTHHVRALDVRGGALSGTSPRIGALSPTGPRAWTPPQGNPELTGREHNPINH